MSLDLYQSQIAEEMRTSSNGPIVQLATQKIYSNTEDFRLNVKPQTKSL